MIIENITKKKINSEKGQENRQALESHRAEAAAEESKSERIKREKKKIYM
jgi:hypothetical protein